MNKLLVSGSSFAMCNWEIKHWGEIIAEENNLDTLFTGIPWGDWESGVFITAGRIMNDPKITHCIWTATYHFFTHYQEEKRTNGKDLIDFDNQLQLDLMGANDFKSKNKILFDKFLPRLSKDPFERRLGTQTWVAHRPDYQQGYWPDEVGQSTTVKKTVDDEGRTFVSMNDEEFFNEPMYKMYLRFYTSLAFIKEICHQHDVKLLFAHFPFTDSTLNSHICKFVDWVDTWDVIADTFGSIPAWKKMSQEKEWVSMASHFDAEGHQMMADAFNKNKFNNEWIKGSLK
jgi:hypothetical protein